MTAGSRMSRSATSLSRSSAGGGGGPLCMTLEENQKHVQEAAMDAYIQGLQKDAHEAVKDTVQWRTTVREGLDEESNERRRRKMKEEANQALVKQQMESNKSRRAEVRREYIQNASAHSFPLFTETFIDIEEFERVRKVQKEQWREELDQQMLVNKTLLNIEEKKARDLAKKNHRENLQSMTKDRGVEFDRLANQGRELVNAWDRDVRIRSLKKAMETGRDVTKEVGYMGRR